MLVGPDIEGLEALNASAKICFSCGQEITDRYKVWWHGAAQDNAKDTAEFVLHTGCAGLLALHLASDALKGDLKNGRHVFDHGSPFPRKD